MYMLYKVKRGAAIADACLPDLHLFGQLLHRGLMTDAHWPDVIVASRITRNKVKMIERRTRKGMKRAVDEVRDTRRCRGFV